MTDAAETIDLDVLLAEFAEAVVAVEKPNTPRLRAVRRRFSRRLCEAKPEQVLALAFRLLESRKPRDRWFAYEFTRREVRNKLETGLKNPGRGRHP